MSKRRKLWWIAGATVCLVVVLTLLAVASMSKHPLSDELEEVLAEYGFVEVDWYRLDNLTDKEHTVTGYSAEKKGDDDRIAVLERLWAACDDCDEKLANDGILTKKSGAIREIVVSEWTEYQWDEVTGDGVMDEETHEQLIAGDRLILKVTRHVNRPLLERIKELWPW